MSIAPVQRTPAQPGPGPVSERLLRALEITVARRMEGLLAGDYRSALLGHGSELAQIRPYTLGDDVRHIDWNVTARTGEPHVRVQHAERVLVTWLVLDTSPSMGFGTAERRKVDVAEGVAIAVGHVATRRGNRLGVVTFGDARPRSTPVRQGRLGLIGLLATLHDGAEKPDRRVGATSLGEAIRRADALARQRSFVVLVSDFRGPEDWRRPLLQLAGRHASSRAGTTSSPSRSATRASKSCPTPVSSGSSTRRRGDSFGSTHGVRSSAAASPKPQRPSAAASRSRLRPSACVTWC